MELDVVAFNPVTSHLVHYETSTDGDSWTKREERFSKKFSSGAKYIKALFEGLCVPDEVERKAIFAIVSDKNHKMVGGGQVVPALDYIVEILHALKGTPFSSRAVPEKYPILRVLQMISGPKERVKVVKELDET